jgi:RNA polymerase sigma-70 factor (ECF subfamily)
MDEPVAERFERDRGQLRAVAYRMLGSVSEADDAVQETWLRLNRADTSEVANLTAWLTTVTARVCLDMLRSRASRREEPIDEPRFPDLLISREDRTDPEHEALLADSVGLALLVVLETLNPAERLAFVLHDMFGVSFEEIAPIVDRSPAAARQLASRARRRVRGVRPGEADASRRREIVDAFLAASRAGDFEGLLSLLDPEVVLRVDDGTLTVVRGARKVMAQANLYANLAQFAKPARVNGDAGFVVISPAGRHAIAGFTVADDRIVEIDILADPERLRALDLTEFEA